MSKLLEFNGLRTQTSFYFKNKKAESKYWKDLLIESAQRYKNEFEKYMNEKLHVLLTYMLIFKYASITMLFLFVVSLLSGNNLEIFNLISCLLFALTSFIFYLRFTAFSIKVIITQTLNTPEFVEDMRELVLKMQEEIEE